MKDGKDKHWTSGRRDPEMVILMSMESLNDLWPLCCGARRGAGANYRSQ